MNFTYILCEFDRYTLPVYCIIPLFYLFAAWGLGLPYPHPISNFYYKISKKTKLSKVMSVLNFLEMLYSPFLDSQRYS